MGSSALQRRSPTHPTHPTPLCAQREYWRERERREGPPLLVEYGNDVDGSLFMRDDRLGASRWNLNVRVFVGWVGVGEGAVGGVGALRGAGPGRGASRRNFDLFLAGEGGAGAGRGLG